MNKRVQMKSVAGAAVVTVLATCSAIFASPAHAANSGSVTCMDQSSVVGVWVTVQGGTSNWARRSGSGYSQSWSYNTQGRPYKLTVGCGGTPKVWASSSSTATFSRNWQHVSCFPGYVYGGGSMYVANTCR